GVKGEKYLFVEILETLQAEFQGMIDIQKIFYPLRRDIAVVIKILRFTKLPEQFLDLLGREPKVIQQRSLQLVGVRDQADGMQGVKHGTAVGRSEIGAKQESVSILGRPEELFLLLSDPTRFQIPLAQKLETVRSDNVLGQSFKRFLLQCEVLCLKRLQTVLYGIENFLPVGVK